MSEAAGTGSDGNKEEFVPKSEYDKAVERSQRFEGMATDYEKRYKNVDIDALKAKAEKADLLERELATADPKRVDALITNKEQEIRGMFQKEIETRDERIARIEAENKELKVVDKIAAIAVERGFIPESLEHVKRDIRENVDLDSEGNFIVKDKDGKALFSKEKPTEKMSVDEYLRSYGNKNPFFLKNPSPGGTRSNEGETNTRGSNGAVSIPGDWEQKSQRDRELWIGQSPEHRKVFLNYMNGR